MKWTIDRLSVDADSENQRLDQFLAGACAELSRSLAKKVIDIGGVHLNGRRVRSCSQLVRSGDSLEVYRDRLPLEPYRIAAADILFQDPYLIVLNKPPLVETQPTHARFKGTLYEALQYHLRSEFHKQRKVEIGMIQRLDRGTSGVILFSIHQRAHKKMTQIFLEHRVEKRYLALVSGMPHQSAGEIRSLLARSRKNNLVKSVEKGGKEAITRYRLLETFTDCALLDIELLTGRSHQIRAHMAEQGWPLLGDVRYGGPQSFAGMDLRRPMLHASSLAFDHPVSAESMRLQCAPAPDMAELLKQLRKVE